MSRSLSAALPLAPGYLVAAALALLVASCAPVPHAGPGPASAPSSVQRAPVLPRGGVDPNQQVTVALLVPLTAADPGAAGIGNALANAARMAATDLGDTRLDLRVYDTGGTAQTARAAAQRAVGEGAALILGPLFAATTAGVGDVAGAAGLNAISFSTDSSVAGGPVFVSGFLPEDEARRIVGYAASRGRNRVAVYYPQTSYGAAALRGAERAANAVGAGVVTAASYPRTFEGIQNTSQSFAGAALAAGANALLLPDSGQGLRSAGAFMDYAGVDPRQVQYLGLGQWNSSETQQEASLDGGWFPSPDPQRVAVFSRQYAARYGASPPFVAVLGYDAVQVAGQLLADARRNGSLTPFGRPELTRVEGFQGALGPLRFDQNGQNRRALAILRVTSRGFEVIDPAPFRLDIGS